MKLFNRFFSLFHHQRNDDSLWLKCADESVKKFGKTYKLLEQYDQQSVEDPSALAGAGRLRPYLRQVQKPD